MEQYEREAIRVYLEVNGHLLAGKNREQIAHCVREGLKFGSECSTAVVRGVQTAVEEGKRLFEQRCGVFAMTGRTASDQNFPASKGRSAGDDVLTHMFDTDDDSSSLYGEGIYLQAILDLARGQSHTIRETPRARMDEVFEALCSYLRRHRPDEWFVIKRYPRNGNIWVKLDDGTHHRSARRNRS